MAGPELVALSPDELENLASLALFRGDLARWQELNALAGERRDEQRWAWECSWLEAHRPDPSAPAPAGWEWKPTGWGRPYLDAVVKLPEQRRRAVRAETDRAVRISLYERTPQTNPDTPSQESTRKPAESEHRARCGVWRWGQRSGRRQSIHLRCKGRTCEHCGPLVRAQRLAAIPDDLELYAVEAAAETWKSSLRRQLDRHVKAGRADGYLRIPVDPETALVVTDEQLPGSQPIHRAQVEEHLRRTSSTAGYVTTSPSWRMESVPAVDWIDEGRMMSSPSLVVKKAKQMGLEVIESPDGSLDFGELAAIGADRDQKLRLIGQVVTHEEERKWEKAEWQRQVRGEKPDQPREGPLVTAALEAAAERRRVA